MKQEEKQLLLKDLCARLPFGVKAKVEGHTNPLQVLSISKLNKSTWAWGKGTWVASFWNDSKSIEQVKPYLRPMSSMTEGEEGKFEETLQYTQYTLESYDWLNGHHFDYRGLIEKGLALEAPEGMYKID